MPNVLSMVKHSPYPHWVDNRAIKRSFRNMVGFKSGMLTVLYRGADKIEHTRRGDTIRRAQWVCYCECGHYRLVKTSLLTMGLATSCGCQQYRLKKSAETRRGTHMKPMIGKKFGYWTVIGKGYRETRPSGEHYYTWKCKCICGTIHYIAGDDLRRGNTKSCGCKARSSMEEYVTTFLLLHTIKFNSQKKFKHLRGHGHGQLSYDFAILDAHKKITMLIECQGRQHYTPIKSWGGKKRFKIQLKHDKLKADYALDHGIPLLAIPYSVDTYQKMANYLAPLLLND